MVARTEMAVLRITMMMPGSSYWAGGGAGWLTDGTGGQNTVDYNYLGEETEDGDGRKNTCEWRDRW